LLIKKGKTFCIKTLNPEVITLSNEKSLDKVEKKAVNIAVKKKFKAVIVKFGGESSSTEIKIVDTQKFQNMGPRHPQFVKMVNGSSFAMVRSAMVV
jgi:hypothetical protein